MESTPAKVIYKTLLIGNDDYDPGLAEDDELQFHPLPGCQQDLSEMRKMLDESSFDTLNNKPITSRNDDQ